MAITDLFSNASKFIKENTEKLQKGKELISDITSGEILNKYMAKEFGFPTEDTTKNKKKK